MALFTVTPNIDGYIIKGENRTIIVKEKTDCDKVELVDTIKLPEYAEVYVYCKDRITVFKLHEILSFIMNKKSFKVTFKKEVV